MAVEDIREQYIPVAEGAALNHHRTMCYRWKKQDDGKSSDWEPVLDPPGAPQVLDCWRVDGESDRKASDEVFYLVRWSHLPDDPPQRISGTEMNDKTAWNKWPGLAISSTRERDFWANVVKGQVGRGEEWELTVRRSQRTTGWHRIGADGRLRYFLRDGRVVGDADTAQEPLALDSYTFPPKHRAAWAEGMATLPTEAPTTADLLALCEWALDVDPKGRFLALIGCAARALIGTIIPSETIAFAVGASGAGKTTTQNFARGIDGPCPPHMDADVQLSNPTPAGIETHLGGLHDLPGFADDLHPKPTDGAHDASRLATLLEMLIYSAANGGEMRARATREARAKVGATLGGLPFVSAESLPLQNESAMRRMIHLAYVRDELNLDLLYTEYEARQKVLTVAGHAIIRRLTASLASDKAKHIKLIRAWEDQMERDLYANLRRERPNAPEAFARSLAHNYARPLTGLWMMAVPASDLNLGEIDALAMMLVGPVIELAAAQLDLMAKGGPGQVNREWIAAVLRSALGQGKAHLLDMDGMKLASAPVSTTRLGYRGEFPAGEEIGNLSIERETVYLLPGETHELLRRAALVEHKGWTWSEKTFPGFLVAQELAMPENSGRSSQRVRIAGRLERRLAVPFTYLFGDDPEGGPSDDDPLSRVHGAHSGHSGHSGHSDAGSRMDSGPEPSSAVTAKPSLAVTGGHAAVTPPEPVTAPVTDTSDLRSQSSPESMRAMTAVTAVTANPTRLTREEIEADRAPRRLTVEQGYSIEPPAFGIPCPFGGTHLWGVAANGFAFACRRCHPELVVPQRKRGMR